MCSLSVHGSRRSCHGNAGALLQPALPLLWRRIVPGAAWGSNYGDLPSPIFFSPTSLHVPFGESFPPHLSSLLVSPLLSGGFPTQQYQQAAGRGGSSPPVLRLPTQERSRRRSHSRTPSTNRHEGCMKNERKRRE